MALFNECMQSCAHIVLDTADIVRDGDFATTISEMGLHAARAGIDNLERATKNFVYFVISTSRP